MNSIVDLKKELVQNWRILQSNENEKKGDAYKKIIYLSNLIRQSDSNFSLDEKALEKYKEFKPNDVLQLNKKVKWVRGRVLTDLKNKYDDYVATALAIVEERLPDVDTDTDKFGTIVNATIANLIAMRGN